MDPLNAIRAIGVEYTLPVVMMVGLQRKEPNLTVPDSAAYGVRIIKPVLNAMLLSHSRIETPEDVAHISAAVDDA
ncbi:MAG: hypothetical protein AB8B62_19060 [Roseobacter sp.]